MNGKHNRRRERFRMGLVLVTAASFILPHTAVFPSPASAGAVHAQDGKRGDTLTWSDTPLVPRYRFQADWLVDVGRETAADAYGPFPTHPYAVGDAETFVPLGSSNGAAQTFVLATVTPHAYFWFERGQTPDPAALQRSADFFESHIWPLNTRIYGGVSSDGIDGDPRMHVVNQQIIGPGILGAFSPEDQCPRTSCPEQQPARHHLSQSERGRARFRRLPDYARPRAPTPDPVRCRW